MLKMYLSEVIKERIKHGVCRKRNNIKLNNMSIYNNKGLYAIKRNNLDQYPCLDKRFEHFFYKKSGNITP